MRCDQPSLRRPQRILSSHTRAEWIESAIPSGGATSCVVENAKRKGWAAPLLVGITVRAAKGTAAPQEPLTGIRSVRGRRA